MRLPLILLTLSVSLTALRGSAQAWPRYGGPGGDFSVGSAPGGTDWSNTPPACLWRTALTDRGYACPSVADGAVFVVDHLGSNDVVRAFDLETGDERWRFAYPDTAVPRNGFARAAPTFDEGRLYTLSRLGQLHVLDAKSGQRLWQTHYVRDWGGQSPEHGFCAPPAVWGDRLILCPGGSNGCVAAVDKRTGERLWRSAPAAAPGHALPVVVPLGGRATLLCFSSEALLALDPATGALFWTFPRPTPFGNNIAQPLVFGDRLLVTSGDGMGTALLKIVDGRPVQVWENKAYHALFTTPVVVGDLILLASNTRHQGLTCASLSTGEVHWLNPRFDKYTSLLRAGALVMALESAKGDLVLLRPEAEAYREITRFKPLGKLSWTPPLIAGDRLIVRNERELGCFRLP